MAPTVRDYVDTLKRDGIVVIPNFLPDDVIDDLRVRAKKICEQDQARTRFSSRPEHVQRLEQRDSSRDSRRVARVLQRSARAGLDRSSQRRPGRFAEKGYMNIERLCQNEPLEMEDPETQLHSDIFFTSHKGWLYLTDVTPDSGPFVYVKGSHRLSPSCFPTFIGKVATAIKDRAHHAT